MLPIILKYRLRQTYNTLYHSSHRKRLGWIVSVAFIVPYYIMLINTMRMIYSGLYDAYGWNALAHLVSVNLAMIFFFVLVSTTALTLYRMFQAKDLPLLMSLPTKDSSLFLVKLTEALMDILRSMILPFPVCIALIYVLIKNSMSFSAAIFLVGWIVVMLQSVSLSVIIALILGKFMSSDRWMNLMRGVAIAAVLMVLLMFMGYVERADRGASAVVGSGSFAASKLSSLSALSPTSWLVNLLPHAGFAFRSALSYLLGFVGITAVLPLAAFYLFRKRFRRLWAMSMETRQSAREKASERKESPAMDTMGTTRAVMLKEVRIMRREPHTWMGLMAPLILFPIFVVLKAETSGTQLVYIVVVSLLTTASYSLSSIGREGRGFHFLRSIPVRMSVFLRAKLILGCALNLFVATAFVVVLYLARRSTLEQVWQNIPVALITSIYLSAFGVAMGAIFPKFDFTNPMRASSMVGMVMLYLVTALFGFSFVWSVFMGWYMTPFILIPWAFIAVILMKVGQQRLEKMDI